MECAEIKKNIPLAGNYDVIVAGGGVAGVTAAVSAAGMCRRTLLVEKTAALLRYICYYI